MREIRTVKIACPLDCFDACSMIATVENGKVVKVAGDKNNPLTAGFICEKGRQHIKRLYHKDRILNSKKRMGNKFVDITYEEAIHEITDKISDVIMRYGSRSILHYFEGGYSGISKRVDAIFFNCLGGATVSRGSLCMGAGQQAQKYDFGDNKSHCPSDLLNSKTIIIWGRNPADNNSHLAQYLRKSQKNGSRIYLIDPIKTNSAKLSTKHIPIRPATDGALALGMANVIISEDLVDHDFVQNHVKGYESFVEYVDQFTPERVEGITGVKAEEIRDLAIAYGQVKPSSIYIGYGMQRYKNAGDTIRCIDALGAITGNIGINGGGVNYSHTSIGNFMGMHLKESEKYVKDRRTFVKAKLGEHILGCDNPPIKMVWVSKANPLVQLPNLKKAIESFDAIPFKVVVDLFMTDTAKHADIVLPATSIFEEDDFIYSSMFSPYLNYSHKVIEPINRVMGEYELFRVLAKKLGLKGYPDIEKDTYLKRELAPLMEKYDVRYDFLKQNSFKIEDIQIPWSDKKFATPSGKFEMISETALKNGQSASPQYILYDNKDAIYNMRLITPHYKSSLNSQNFAFEEGNPVAYVHPDDLVISGIEDGQTVFIESKYGKLKVTIKADAKILSGVIMIYQGWWHRSGSVNFLTPDEICDMGEQTTYYECFCRIIKDV